MYGVRRESGLESERENYTERDRIVMPLLPQHSCPFLYLSLTLALAPALALALALAIALALDPAFALALVRIL